MLIGDSFTFTKDNKAMCSIVVISKKDEEDMHCADILVNAVKEISGVKVDVVEHVEDIKTNNKVFLGSIESNPIIEKILSEESVIVTIGDVEKVGYLRALSSKDLGSQGFLIYKTRESKNQYYGCLILTGATPIGTFYAVSTLKDRLHMEDDQLIVDGLNTRLMPIVNIPAFKHRSVFTGLGGPDWMGPGQYMKEFGYNYKAFIDWLGEHKFNNLLIQNFVNLCWGINYDSQKFPELVNHFHPNVKREFIRDLIQYAHKRNIKIFFGIDIPDFWCGVINTYPEFAGKNVDWSYFPKGEDWYSFAKGKGDWRYAWIENDSLGRRNVLSGKAKQVRKKASWVCLSNPKVMEFWREYWKEILDRYPDVDGIGGQFSEHLMICNCEKCSKNGFFMLASKYFKVMEEVAQSKNPKIKLWLFTVPGVRDIIKHKEEILNLILIDWGLSFQPFMFNRVVPKSDWYLCHGGGQLAPFAVKQFCSKFNKLGLNGIQIRGVEFKELDRHYQSFEEFLWNPQLSIEDYAHLYTIKELRRKDRKVTEAYCHLIKAQGYFEILKYNEIAPVSLKDSLPPQAWIQEEQYQKKFELEIENLDNTLKGMEVSHEFIKWLKNQAKILHYSSIQSDHIE